MKICKVCGKETSRLIKGMCSKHYNQFKRHGKCLDNNPRTRRDMNEIIIYDTYAELILYNKKYEEIARTKIDLEDITKVRNYKWYLNGNGYVVSNTTSRTSIKLHRLIMDCPKDKVVDHINLDKLDNRKSNLRTCTTQQNNMNKGVTKNNTSGYHGVYWDKKNFKWMALIQIKGKQIYLGRFNTKEDAIEVRKQAEIKYFGEYRNKS